MGTDESKNKVTLAVAADHGGIALKNHLVGLLGKWGYDCQDMGTHNEESVDYPDFARKLAQAVAAGDYRLGVLVCGTGIGMSMVANRVRGVRAALCSSAYTARMARAHNDANVLCLGDRVTGFGEAEDILHTFLNQEFEGGRHARRIGKFDPVENG